MKHKEGSMQTVRRYWAILPGLLLVLLFTAPAWVRSAQTTPAADNRIVPMFYVAPNLLFAKQQASIYVCFWNGNYESKGTMEPSSLFNPSKLQPGDTFKWAFDESKMKIDGIEPTPIVFSDTFTSDEFEGFHQEGSNEVAMVYKGAEKPLPPGDMVFVRVYVSVDSATGPALAIFRKPGDDSRFNLDSTYPPFAVFSVIDGVQGPQGIKGDKGDIGPMGPQGFTGPAGENGCRYVFTSITTDWFGHAHWTGYWDCGNPR